MIFRSHLKINSIFLRLFTAQFIYLIPTLFLYALAIGNKSVVLSRTFPCTLPRNTFDTQILFSLTEFKVGNRLLLLGNIAYVLGILAVVGYYFRSAPPKSRHFLHLLSHFWLIIFLVPIFYAMNWCVFIGYSLLNFTFPINMGFY